MLTLSTTPEQEEALQKEAQRLGLSPEQLLLSFLAERLPQNLKVDDDETKALDELLGCLADVPSIVSHWRRYKEEEMALEEEKFQRHFRGR